MVMNLIVLDALEQGLDLRYLSDLGYFLGILGTARHVFVMLPPCTNLCFLMTGCLSWTSFLTMGQTQATSV